MKEKVLKKRDTKCYLFDKNKIILGKDTYALSLSIGFYLVYQKSYPKVMLPDIRYQDLEDEIFEDITHLEFETMRNLSGFVEDVRDILLQENLAQMPQLMVAHLCAYLGFLTTASLGIKQATVLNSEIVKLLTEQTKKAYDTFCQYSVNADLPTEEKESNLDQLRRHSPGSLVVQTVRLGRVIWDSLHTLSYKRSSHGLIREKQTELFCPQDAFLSLLKKRASRTLRESKKGVPIHYVLNQMTIQLAWLMGYFGHLDRKFPLTYLEYGKPCIQLYREYGHKFLKVKRHLAQR